MDGSSLPSYYVDCPPVIEESQFVDIYFFLFGTGTGDFQLLHSKTPGAAMCPQERYRKRYANGILRLDS